MITINVCIGSACHIRGSYNVISELQKLIELRNLSDKIEVKATFCLGNCSESVAVKVNDESIETVTSDKINDFFDNRILPLLN